MLSLSSLSPPPPQGDVEPEPSGGAKCSATVRGLGTAGSAAGETWTDSLINLHFCENEKSETSSSSLRPLVMGQRGEMDSFSWKKSIKRRRLGCTDEH